MIGRLIIGGISIFSLFSLFFFFFFFFFFFKGFERCRYGSMYEPSFLNVDLLLLLFFLNGMG